MQGGEKVQERGKNDTVLRTSHLTQNESSRDTTNTMAGTSSEEAEENAAPVPPNTVDTVSVHSEELKSMHHLRWMMAVRQCVSVDLFKHVQFVNRDEDTQRGSGMQRVVCKTRNIPADKRQACWESHGRDEVLEVMGRRRQAMAQSIRMKFGSE
jgi:hypothetical protein